MYRGNKNFVLFLNPVFSLTRGNFYFHAPALSLFTHCELTGRVGFSFFFCCCFCKFCCGGCALRLCYYTKYTFTCTQRDKCLHAFRLFVVGCRGIRLHFQTIDGNCVPMSSARLLPLDSPEIVSFFVVVLKFPPVSEAFEKNG